MRLFCFPLLLLLLAGPAMSQAPVDAALLARVADGADAEFLVIMTQQADIGLQAGQIKNTVEKSRFLRDTLSALAAATQQDILQLLENRQAPARSFWIINGIWSKGNLDLIREIAQMPGVARIEDNPIMHISRPPDDHSPIERTASPWGLSKIKARNVWHLGYRGQGVVIGGQDTGYEWEHPIIKSQYRGWNGSTVNHNYYWHDAISALIGSGNNSCGLNLLTPCDDNAHGTHTMGTMVGIDGADTLGVAPEAKWIGCRNMEEGDGTPATYIECFEWFIAPTDLNEANADPAQKPDVINNSWGCPVSEGCNSSNYATMNTVITNVRNAGILVVVSAGNSGSNCSTVNAPPAIFAPAFAVGATDINDNIAGFSSRGPATAYSTMMKPDVSAPGVDVLSCIGRDNNPATYNTASYNGTSMAGPHVAGLAALVMSARPDLKGNVNVLETLIKSNCTPRYASAPFCGSDNASSLPNNVYGWGRVDALATVNAALALPVEWVHFSVEARNKQSYLRWETAAEFDCREYIVQRSGNSLQWTSIGTLSCRNSPYGAQYEFWDIQPLEGVNYYRLEQIDFNGSVNRSGIVSLSFNAGGVDMLLRPDYTADMVFVDLVRANADDETFAWELHSFDGRLLRQTTLYQSQSVVLENLPTGLYIAVLRNTNGAILGARKLWWRE